MDPTILSPNPADAKAATMTGEELLAHAAAERWQKLHRALFDKTAASTAEYKGWSPSGATVELIVAWMAGLNVSQRRQAGCDGRQFVRLQSILEDTPHVSIGDLTFDNDQIAAKIEQEQQRDAPAKPIASRHRGVSRPSGAESRIKHCDIEVFVEAVVELGRVLACRHVESREVCFGTAARKQR